VVLIIERIFMMNEPEGIGKEGNNEEKLIEKCLDS